MTPRIPVSLVMLSDLMLCICSLQLKLFIESNEALNFTRHSSKAAGVNISFILSKQMINMYIQWVQSAVLITLNLVGK